MSNLTVRKNIEPTSVNPSHYRQHPSGVECIQIIKHLTFCVGTAIKYCWRAGLKGNDSDDLRTKHIEDLNKARWYLKQEIELLGGKVIE